MPVSAKIRLTNLLFWIGFVMMLFSGSVPAVGGLGFLIWAGAIAAFVVQLPARRRLKRARRGRHAYVAAEPEQDLTAGHSPDWEPHVIRVDELTGRIGWQCLCGRTSAQGFLAEDEARKDFIAHKYGPISATIG